MQWTPLPPAARRLFYLQAFSRLVMFWFPMSVMCGVTLASNVGLVTGFGVAAGGLFVVFLSAMWMPSLTYDRWAYALRDEDLLIARGVFFRSVTAIPTQRIQHVDLHQGPLEQWFQLTRVQIYTASGMGADGIIPGVALDVAEALRDQLVAVAGDDGV
jgi:membrane protein YdbS with pleckstrin-like domain